MELEEDKPFYLPQFYEITKTAIENDKDIEIDKLLPVYHYMTKLFFCLGKAFGFATGDVTTKLNHIKQRRNDLIQTGELAEDPHLLLYTLMKLEETKGQNMSGSNGINGQGKEFQCASRSVLRLTWFLDFIYEIIKQVYENPSLSLQSIVRSSYHLTLENRHNFIVRNAFKVAVVVCPSRDTFIDKIRDGLSEEQFKDYWVKTQDNLRVLKDLLWTLYKDNGWAELP
ncbi:hypothetical protein WA158_007847 [Blastocystis sp. Blastoise]